MLRKTYFRMPNFDYPPNELVQLGQIVTSPKQPYESLAPPVIPIPQLQINKKENYLDVVADARKGEIGLWGLFMASILGVGADIRTNWARENSHYLEFRELETTFFEPDNKYVKQSLESAPQIMEYIKKYPRKSVYMVTGLKVARGAKCGGDAKKAVGIELNFGVNATMLTGVPGQGGPSVKGEVAHREGLQFSRSSDFVFAYRLRRIIVTYRGNIEARSFVRGAQTFEHRRESFTDQDDDEEEEQEERPEISTIFLENVDFGTNGVTFKASSVEVHEEDMDRNNLCVLITPAKE